MVKRAANCGENEPEQKSFPKPSEGEHLFQVVDIYDSTNAPGKMSLDSDTVCVKIEVVGGAEEGRSMLQRLNLNDQWKGFFATRLFLKAIGEAHKGSVEIDTDRWIGHQFYASVIYNGEYANIDEYLFEKNKLLSAGTSNPGGVTNPKDIGWEE
jgi:hypothetical protein